MRALIVQQGLVEALDGEDKLEKMMADGGKESTTAEGTQCNYPQSWRQVVEASL